MTVTTNDISSAGKTSPARFPGSFLDKYDGYPIKALKINDIEHIMYTYQEKFSDVKDSYYLLKDDGSIVGAVVLGGAFDINLNQSGLFTEKQFETNFYGYVVKDIEIYDEVKKIEIEEGITFNIEKYLPENLIDIDVIKNSNEEMVIAAAVLVPNTVDLHGDIYDEPTVKAAAYYFMEHYLESGNGIDVMHDGIIQRDAIKLLQTFITEEDKSFDVELDIADNYSLKGKNEIKYPKGTWIIYARINSESLWEDVKEGKLTGWSIAGLVNVKEINKILSYNSNRDKTNE